MDELLGKLAFCLIFGFLQTLGVGMWLDTKLLNMIKPPEEQGGTLITYLRVESLSLQLSFSVFYGQTSEYHQIF